MKEHINYETGEVTYEEQEIDGVQDFEGALYEKRELELHAIEGEVLTEEDEGFEYNDIGRAIDFKYATWETAEGAAIDAHQKEQEASFELAQVACAVWRNEREEGMKRLTTNLPMDAKSLYKNYALPFKPLQHLNKVSRETLLSHINLTLYHFRVAGPIAGLDPDTYERLLNESEEHSWSATRLGAEVKKAKKEITSGVGGPLPEATERLTLIQSPVAELAKHIKPESVDVIITDPPYPEKYLECFEELSEAASTLLKDGGSAFIMSGQSYLPQIMEMLGKHMNYQWTLAYLTPGGQSAQLWDRKVNTFWKPILWYVKGEYEGDWLGDVSKSQVNDNDKRFHHWGQSESGMLDIIERCSNPADLVLDPFVGGGATAVAALALNRRFVGSDIDSKALETTNRRIERLEEESEEDMA